MKLRKGELGRCHGTETIPLALPSSSLKYFKASAVSFPGTSSQRSWCQLKPVAAPTAGQGRLGSASLCDPWSPGLCYCSFQVRPRGWESRTQGSGRASVPEGKPHPRV